MENSKFVFIVLECLIYRHPAEQAIKIKYNKAIPFKGQESIVTSWSSITMTPKKRRPALDSDWALPSQSRKIPVAFHGPRAQHKHSHG